MTAAPGPRTPLVLAHSLLSSFLAANPQRCGANNSGLHIDLLHHTDPLN